MTNSSFNFLNLSDLNGTNGFIINGIAGGEISGAAGDYSGTSVSNAADINNDGIDDLIIGAQYASPNGKYVAGQSYVVFGVKNLGSGGTPRNLTGTPGARYKLTVVMIGCSTKLHKLGGQDAHPTRVIFNKGYAFLDVF